MIFRVKKPTKSYGLGNTELWTEKNCFVIKNEVRDNHVYLAAILSLLQNLYIE